MFPSKFSYTSKRKGQEIMKSPLEEWKFLATSQDPSLLLFSFIKVTNKNVILVSKMMISVENRFSFSAKSMLDWYFDFSEVKMDPYST